MSKNIESKDEINYYACKREIRKYGIFILCMSVISIGLCIFIICQLFPMPVNNKFDSMGILIGALAIITSVLVAWQIFQIVNFKNTTEEFKRKMDIRESKINELEKEITAKKIEINDLREMIQDEKQEIDDEKQKIDMVYGNASIMYSSSGGGLMEIYRDVYNKYQDSCIAYRSIYWGLEVVYTIYSKLKDDSLCEQGLSDILFYAKDFKEIKCTPEQKLELLKILECIEKKYVFKSYGEVEKLVEGIIEDVNSTQYSDSASNK